MSLSHITSHSLRRVLTLTEKKEELLKIIEDVESEIAKVLHGAATSVVEVAEAVTPFKPAKAKGKKTRKAKSGGLKDRILALLHDAGDQGLKVKEIAEKLAANPGNISVWFSTTGKKLTTKVEPGRYAVKGAKPAVAAKLEVKAPGKAVAPKKKARKKAKKAAKSESVPSVAKVPMAAKKQAKAKKKGGISPEGRAKLAANMKARWAARKAGKKA